MDAFELFSFKNFNLTIGTITIILKLVPGKGGTYGNSKIQQAETIH